MSHGNNAFTKDKLQYGEDDKTKQLMNQKKSYQYTYNNMVNH